MNAQLEVHPSSSSRLHQWAVIVFTLGVFGAALLLVSLQLRRKIQDQILRRDSEVLNAIALMQQCANDSPTELGAVAQDPLDHIAAVLETSRLRDALAVRLFDARGTFVTAFPPNATESNLSRDDLEPLHLHSPVTRYHPHARLAEYLHPPTAETAEEATTAILDVLIPLPSDHSQPIVGVAQFILDGQKVQTELAASDGYLVRHAATVFVVGSLVIILALGWVFRRLERANRLLAQRTQDLLQANYELTLAAKTSALGTVTAHLLHGLKNPLSGLKNFVASGSCEAGALDQDDWRYAAATTQRMQALINDMVRILQEENGGGQYEIQLEELMAMITSRIQPAALEAHVRCDIRLLGHGVLSNRDANLVMLIPENLIQNALQATPAGQAVRLTVTNSRNDIVFEIEDEGTGLPENVRTALFLPCRSSKPGGSGIGLALSKQLATQLGADLSLWKSTPEGSVFRLALPLQRTQHTPCVA